MKKIRLTESNLKNIIREAVKNVLSEEEYDEYDNIVALARYLDCDPSELEQTSECCFQAPGGQEWFVFDSVEDAEWYVMNDYDAPRFMEDCWSSGEEFYNFLQKNPNSAAYYDLEKVFPNLGGDHYYDDYDEETGEEIEREFDPYEFPEMFTQNVDWEYVAQVVLDVDGPQWYLAGYDGEEHELQNGSVAYRYN